MPTFTAIVLDRLLEPESRHSDSKPPPVPIKVDRPAQKPADQKSIHLKRPSISPALYATPETTPLPDSPSSFPPSSPYIITHKRRGPRLLKTSSLQSEIRLMEQQNGVPASEPESNVGEVLPLVPDAGKKVEAPTAINVKIVANSFQERKIGDDKSVDDDTRQSGTVAIENFNGNLIIGNSEDSFIEVQDSPKPVSVDHERDVEVDDFFDPQDSLSQSSNIDVDDLGKWKPNTPMSDYYDAIEEISSIGSARSSFHKFGDELREIRMDLFMEMERRKQAEEALENLQNKWQMLSHNLSLMGLGLPAPQTITDEIGEKSQPNIDPAEELCQQIAVARFFADTVGRGSSRAEVELEIESKLEAKNFEIARLFDRLQFYEAANREMSQMNQEAVELARQQRNRHERRHKWFWGSICVSVTLGAAAIAWTYMPSSRSHSEGDNKH